MTYSHTARKRLVFYLPIQALSRTTHKGIQKEGVSHNLVAICRHNGMPAQVAFNHVGEMLIERYRDWYLALAALPTWGERIDADVQEYIRGVQNVVRANLHWR